MFAAGQTRTGHSANTPAHLLVLWAFAILAGLAQSLAGAAGGLLAAEVAGSDGAAGLPQTMLVIGGAAAAVGLSEVAARWGRANSLSAGALLGATGCFTVAYGGVSNRLTYILVGSLLVGAGNAAVMLSRYAAVDLQPNRSRARAMASVMGATTVGAVVGPNLLGPAAWSAELVRAPALVLSYLAAGATFILAGAIISVIRPDGPVNREQSLSVARPALTRRAVPVGIDTGREGVMVLSVANLVMVGVMTMAPLHLRHGGAELSVIGMVVSVHIAGMFAPSVISGRLVESLGGRKSARLALAVVGAACLWASSTGPRPVLLGGAMLLLGAGWNLALVAGSDLLTRSVATAARPRRESLGELAMGLAAAVGGSVSGPVDAALGYSALAVLGGVVPVSVVFVLICRAGRPPEGLAGSPTAPTGRECTVPEP